MGKIAGHALPNLSEQQLVDCDKVDAGCNGGLMDQGFTFFEKHAACTEAGYPYTAKGGSCKEDSFDVAIPKGAVKGYKDVTGGEAGLASAVQQQPVSVAIEADQMSFQLYNGGVMIDHGVLTVGFGTDGGSNYW